MCQCRATRPKALGRDAFSCRSGTSTPVGVAEREAPLPVQGLAGAAGPASQGEAAGKPDYCRDLACNLADQSPVGKNKKCGLKQSLSRLDPRWLLF